MHFLKYLADQALHQRFNEEPASLLTSDYYLVPLPEVEVNERSNLVYKSTMASSLSADPGLPGFTLFLGLKEIRDLFSDPALSPEIVIIGKLYARRTCSSFQGLSC